MFHRRLLFLIVILFTAALFAGEIHLNQTSNFWRLGNADLEYSISKSDATIRKILEKKS